MVYLTVSEVSKILSLCLKRYFHDISIKLLKTTYHTFISSNNIRILLERSQGKDVSEELRTRLRVIILLSIFNC